MERLKRKIDDYLLNWKNDGNRKPLIIKGARQIGKTNAIRNFGKNNYKFFVEINFVYRPEFKDIFDNGFMPDDVISAITFHDSKMRFKENETLIFFDEIQQCPNTATALKPFYEDGRYDVICSGSLMGINYNEIESNSVGNKEDYVMHSMDFEEFLWALGYNDKQINELYSSMINVKPLTSSQMASLDKAFKNYVTVGGMPEIVSEFVSKNTFNKILDMQKQILLDYEEDITKYAGSLDKTKILNCYRQIPIFLGKENKKFMYSQISKGARAREYEGVIEWLLNAGIVNICYSMKNLDLPLKANFDPSNFRLYFADTGLLIGSLEEKAQKDFRDNKNFNTYKGALFENIVSDMLVKSGLDLFFYKNDSSKIEMDFINRDNNNVVPIEVKAGDNSTKSLNNLINHEKYNKISYGIKLSNNNIGFNGNIFTFPYFLAFLVNRFLEEIDIDRYLNK